MRKFHIELSQMISDNLSKLEIDKDGVLEQRVKAKSILFDDKMMTKKLENIGKKLISETVEKFGNKTMKEINAEKVKRETK